jgi:hypothetical protein
MSLPLPKSIDQTLKANTDAADETSSIPLVPVGDDSNKQVGAAEDDHEDTTAIVAAAVELDSSLIDQKSSTALLISNEKK